jgi:Flp pilus assembly pilin Flp
MIISGLLRSLVVDDEGQELVEYAVLAALVVVAGYAALLALQAQLHTSYTNWDSRTQSIADMPAPGAGT